MRVVRDRASAVAVTNKLQRSEHGAAVIKVTMRQNDGLDRTKVDAEARHVPFENHIFRSGVEQQCPRRGAFADRDEAGKPMCGTAHATAIQHPVASPAPSQAGPFGFDKRRNRGQAIGDVVDEDLDLDALHRLKHAHLPFRLSSDRARLPARPGQRP